MSAALEDRQDAPRLLSEQRHGIRTLTLHRPERRNAIDAATFVDLERALRDAALDDDVRVLVLTGAGDTFSAGADLTATDAETRRELARRRFAGDPGGDILDRGNRCVLGLRRLPKPVIARIDGDALGIACGLALACDLRVASQRARLRFVFTEVGLAPDGGTSRLLTEHVGAARALELLMLAEWLGADEAQRLGLFTDVVRAEELDATVDAVATRLAAGPTLAYGATKAAVYQGAGLPFEAALDLEARLARTVGRSRDAAEGVRAFREKRDPKFHGH